MALDSRKRRRDQRRFDMQQSRIENGHKKRKERARRDATMKALIKKGKFPYTPPVLSWLSEKLNKPGRLITPEDVKKAVA
jgi:hypothetical protein